MAAWAPCRYENALTSVSPRKAALVLVLAKAVVFSSAYVQAPSVPVAQDTCLALERVGTLAHANKDMRATAKAARTLTSVRGDCAYSVLDFQTELS